MDSSGVVSEGGDQPTEEVMVISVRSHDVFHLSELLNNSPGVVTVWCGCDDPDIPGRKLNGRRTTPHWEEPEEFGKGPRECNHIRGDLRRTWGSPGLSFCPEVRVGYTPHE